MKDQKSITHNNHYVPRFYLKYWSNNGNTIHTYNGILRHKSRSNWNISQIKSTACFPDYYTDKVDGYDDDKIENLFSKIESKAKPIFDSIVHGDILTKADFSNLVDYLIIQLARTPAFFDYSNSILETKFEELFEEIIIELETKLQNQENISLNLDISKSGIFLPINLELDKRNNTIAAKSCTGRHAFLSSVLSLDNSEIASLLRKSNWKILFSEESLFTSDNPVVFLRTDTNGRLWRTGLYANTPHDLRAIYLPLTPHHLLITLPGVSKKDMDSLAFTKDFCQLIQYGTVSNAYRYIYSDHEDNRVSKWRPQIIDEELFLKLENERKQWHKYNTMLEKDFFPQNGITIID